MCYNLIPNREKAAETDAADMFLWLRFCFVFFKIVCHDGCTTLWVYRKPLNCTLKWVNVNYILNFIYLFIYLWLCWIFVSVRGLSLVVASGDHSSSRCAGRSLSRPLLLRSTGSRRAGSAVVAHGPSCSVACGIFPDQGSNPYALHWQADSQPLRHQGSPLWLWFLPKITEIHSWCKGTMNIRIYLYPKKWGSA